MKKEQFEKSPALYEREKHEMPYDMNVFEYLQGQYHLLIQKIEQGDIGKDEKLINEAKLRVIKQILLEGYLDSYKLLRKIQKDTEEEITGHVLDQEVNEITKEMERVHHPDGNEEKKNKIESENFPYSIGVVLEFQKQYRTILREKGELNDLARNAAVEENEKEITRQKEFPENEEDKKEREKAETVLKKSRQEGYQQWAHDYQKMRFLNAILLGHGNNMAEIKIYLKRNSDAKTRDIIDEIDLEIEGIIALAGSKKSKEPYRTIRR